MDPSGDRIDVPEVRLDGFIQVVHQHRRFQAEVAGEGPDRRPEELLHLACVSFGKPQGLCQKQGRLD